MRYQKVQKGKVVVAHLAEQSLLIPEEPGFNPATSIFLYHTYRTFILC